MTGSDYKDRFLNETLPKIDKFRQRLWSHMGPASSFTLEPPEGWHIHVNTAKPDDLGGLVEDTAYVAENVTLWPSVVVCDDATVMGDMEIQVAYIGGDSHIRGGSSIFSSELWSCNVTSSRVSNCKAFNSSFKYVVLVSARHNRRDSYVENSSLVSYRPQGQNSYVMAGLNFQEAIEIDGTLIENRGNDFVMVEFPIISKGAEIDVTGMTDVYVKRLLRANNGDTISIDTIEEYFVGEELE